MVQVQEKSGPSVMGTATVMEGQIRHGVEVKTKSLAEGELEGMRESEKSRSTPRFWPEWPWGMRGIRSWLATRKVRCQSGS